MSDAAAPALRSALTSIAAATPGLALLLLFGSRARGDARPASDWDFGYLASPQTAIDGLRAALVRAIGTDRIDLVDLDRAGALLRYRAARDASLLYERAPGADARFRLAAADFWCDAGPLLQGLRKHPRGDRSVTALDRDILAERAMSVERHLARVAHRLPPDPSGFLPATDASDAVILHLWQATQIVIDLAMGACVSLNLGAPGTYAEAFRRLEQAGVLDGRLADALARAAGFRNVIAHAYDTLDMTRVYTAAQNGPADLRAFLAILRDRARPLA